MGPPAVAVASRTGTARTLLSGSQRGVLSRLDCSPGPAASPLVLRRLSVRHRGLLLAGGYSAGLCSPWAVFCQQRVPFTSGHPARGGFEPQRALAGALALLSGRELAPQPSCSAGLSPARLDGRTTRRGLVGHRGVGTAGTRNRGAEAKSPQGLSL